MQSVLDSAIESEKTLSTEPHNVPKPVNQEGFSWTTLLTVIVVIGGSIWGLHYEFSRVFDRIGEVDKHLTKVESAVRIVGTAQGTETQKLIDEVLSIAQIEENSGNGDRAARLIDGLQKVVAHRQEVSPLSKEAILETAEKMEGFRSSQNHAVSQEAFHGILSLANYHSAIATIPPDLSSKKVVNTIGLGEMGRINGHFYLSDSIVSGNVLDNTVNGVDIDGMILQNVVFQNVRIIYKGGSVSMHNVHFINCEIQAPVLPQSDRFLLAIIHEVPVAYIS